MSNVYVQVFSIMQNESSSPKIRVLHCLGWVSKGGVEQRRALLAEHLLKSKYEHMIICQVADGPILNRLIQAGWEVREIGLARHILDVRWYWRAIRIAVTFQPDIVHGAVYEGQALAIVTGFAVSKSKTIIEETSDARGRKWSGHLLMAILCRLADRCVGVAPEIYNYLRFVLKVSSNKLRLVTNGVVPSIPKNIKNARALRSEFGINANDLVIGSTGRLDDDHKRFSDLIKAMPRVLESFPNARLLIVGEGRDKSYLQEITRNLGIESRIVFAGYREDVRSVHQVMDIFALVSAGEALPLALIEAMHSGLPAVASAVGGTPYVLDQGGCGLLVSPGNLDEIARAILRLLWNPAERATIGALGQARARSFFSSDRYSTDVESLWAEVLEE